jgi:hypothetical protein
MPIFTISSFPSASSNQQRAWLGRRKDEIEASGCGQNSAPQSKAGFEGAQY